MNLSNVINRRDDVAAGSRIRINNGASSIRLEVACETNMCSDNRIRDCSS